MNKFSPEIKEIIKASKAEASKNGDEIVGAEHLLLGILQDDDYLANKVFESLDVDIQEVKEYIQKQIKSDQKADWKNHLKSSITMK